MKQLRFTICMQTMSSNVHPFASLFECWNFSVEHKLSRSATLGEKTYLRIYVHTTFFLHSINHVCSVVWFGCVYRVKLMITRHYGHNCMVFFIISCLMRDDKQCNKNVAPTVPRSLSFRGIVTELSALYRFPSTLCRAAEA